MSQTWILLKHFSFIKTYYALLIVKLRLSFDYLGESRVQISMTNFNIYSRVMEHM